MKLPPCSLTVIMSAIAKLTVSITCFISYIAISANADATPKPNQAANLVTEPATISNKWNLGVNNALSNDTNLQVSEPECQKINPLDYLNNPEAFFQPCSADNRLNPQNFEPIEYLKVPPLDSGLSITVTNF